MTTMQMAISFDAAPASANVGGFNFFFTLVSAPVSTLIVTDTDGDTVLTWLKPQSGYKFLWSSGSVSHISAGPPQTLSYVAKPYDGHPPWYLYWSMQTAPSMPVTPTTLFKVGQLFIETP